MSNTIIFTGPRDLSISQETIAFAIKASGFGMPTEIVVGSKKGLDYCAYMFAYYNTIEKYIEPALWGEYGKGAGPIRNMAMANSWEADGCIAFVRRGKPVTSGTASMIAEAVRANIPVHVYEV